MILVTGATGFVGRHLVAALVDRGEAVRVLVRGASPFEEGTVEVAVGDVTDPSTLGPALSGITAVLHLAGHYRGDDDQLWRVHAEGTANVVHAADPGARIVLLSSTSVYGWDQPWPASEETPPRPEGAYGRAKVAAERSVLGRHDVTGIVARTTIVYGPGDDRGMLTRAAALLRRGWRWFPGDGRNRIHLTHVDDVVRGLLALAEGGSGGTYLLAGPAATPIAEVLGGLAAVLGASAPRFVGSRSARIARRLGAGLGHSVDVLTVDRAFVPSRRAAAEVGWSPQVELAEGLATLVPITGGGMRPAACPGPPWEQVIEDHDEGVGSVYERFVLRDVIDDAVERVGATSILDAPLFGMTGVPGIDAIFQARRGMPVSLLDVDGERLDAVVRLWKELGCEPADTHLAPWPDTSAWTDLLPAGSVDLVVSFAALWWCRRPEEVLAASAAWARKGVLLCIPNRNIFTQVRSRFWHAEMFDHLHEGCLDRAWVEGIAAEAGLELVDTGLFDLPPFPDIAISIKELVPALARGGDAVGGDAGDAWRWEVVSYLKGDDPGLPERLRKFGVLEHRLGQGRIAGKLAHHRYWLFVPRSDSSTQSQ